MTRSIRKPTPAAAFTLLARHQDADARKDFDKYLHLNPAAKDNLDQRIKYAEYQRTKRPKPEPRCYDPEPSLLPRVSRLNY